MLLHELIDHHYRVESPIHRLRAGVKSALALGVVAAAVVLPLPAGWPVLAVLGAFLAGVALASRLPWTFLGRRLLLLEPFALGVAVLALLRPGGAAVFAGVLARSTVCLLAVILLSATTPFAELLEVSRRMGVPSILVSVVALMYRYLFVLIDESGRMGRARSSRTFTRGRLLTWSSSAAILGQLFVRSAGRAERVYSAMCARGWR